MDETLPGTSHRFYLPEPTLRLMKNGDPAAIRKTWRVAAAALVTGGDPQELDDAGCHEAADMLRDLRTQYLRAREAEDSAAPADLSVMDVAVGRAAQVTVVVPPDLTDRELDRVRAAAEQFAAALRSKRS
ncbi:hypothetical protein [Nonomuraea sp. NPDC049695]|uniref:hypothetical protein n=1 Tax=Nonomuraea sp. NPDC049695 TaxID=3154734 RepID=UPI0034255680